MNRGMLAAVLALSIAGCAAPEFVVDGPFARPLKEFRRIEAREATVALEQAATSREQADAARTFAAGFGQALVHRLHRWNVLDGADGPWLRFDVRIVAYEWEFSAGSSESPPRATASIRVAVTFHDEDGKRIGGGTVASVDWGSSTQAALERAEKKAVSSVYKFIRKAVGKKAAPETPEPEPPAPDLSP